MLEKLVTNMITSYMGKYLENLDRKNVSVSLWNGSVDLNNLKVRQTALRGMNLPISVKEGRVGQLKVRIPWTRLQSEPVIFSITDLIIILHPKSAALYDEEAEEEERLAYKREQLEALDHMREAGVTESSASPTSAASPVGDVTSDQHQAHVAALEKAKDNSFSSRLKASMLSNAQLEVKNIIICYEDMITDPTLPVHFTIRLDEFSVHSCTAENEPTFSNPADRLLYKLLQCSAFRVDLDIGKRSSRGEGGKSIADIIAMVSERTTATATSSPSSPNSRHNQLIVRPTDFRLRLQHQPIPYDLSTPKWLATARIPNAEVCIDRQQWDCVWRSVKYVERYDDIKAFFRFRPPSDSHWTPFLRWQFAINATLYVVRKRLNRNKIKWEELIARKRMQQEYVELYKRAQPEAKDWCLELAPEEVERVKAIEKALPLEMLRAGRKLAYARLDMERFQYEKRVEYHAKQEAKRERRMQRKLGAAGSSSSAAAAHHDNNSSGKVGWLAWMTGSYVKPTPVKRDILDICDEDSSTNANSSANGTGANSEEDEDDDDKTKFTEEEAAEMYSILDAKKWTAEQRRILAAEFGLEWDEGTGVTEDVAAMMAMDESSTSGDGNRSKRTHAFKLQRDGIRAGSIEDDEGAPPPTSQRELYDLSASFEMVRLNIVLMDYKRCPFADFTLEGAVLTYHSTKSTFGAHIALRRVHVLDASIANSRPIVSAASARAIAPHPSCPRQNMFVLKVQKLDKAAKNTTLAGGGAPILSGVDMDVAFSSAPFDVCFMVPWMQQVVSFWGEDEIKAMNKAAAAAAAANAAAAKNGVATSPAAEGTTTKVPIPNAGSPLVQLLMASERHKITSINVSLHGMRLLIPEARKSRDSETVFVKQEAAIEIPLLILENDPKFSLERRKVLQKIRSKLRNNDRPELITKQLYPEGVQPAHYCNNFYLQIKDLRIGTSYLDPTVKPPRKPEILSHYILTKATLNLTLRKLIIKDNYDVPGTSIDISTAHELCVEGPRKMWLVLLNAVTLLLEFNNNKNGKGSKMVEQGKIFRRGESGEPFHARVIGPRQRFIDSDEDVRPLNQQLASVSPVNDQDRYVVLNFGALLMFHAERPSMPFLQMELKQHAYTVVPHQLDPKDLKRNRIHKDYIYYDEEEDENGEVNKNRVFAVTVYIHSGGADHSHRKGLFAARELLAKYKIPLFNSLPQQHQATEFVTALLSSTRKISDYERQQILDAYAIVQKSFHTNPCEAVTFVFTTEAEQAKFAAECVKNASPDGFVAPPPEGISYRGELAPPLPIQNQQGLSLNVQVPGLRVSIVEPPVRMTDGSGALSAPLVASLEIREKVHIAFATTMFRRNLTLSADTLTLYAPSAKYFRSFELDKEAADGDDNLDENGQPLKTSKKDGLASATSGYFIGENEAEDLLEDEVKQNETLRKKSLANDEYGVFKDVNQLVKRLRTQRGSDVYSHAAALVKDLMDKFLANDGTAANEGEGVQGPNVPPTGMSAFGNGGTTASQDALTPQHQRAVSHGGGIQHSRTVSAVSAAGGDRIPADFGTYAFDASVAELLEGTPVTATVEGGNGSSQQIGGSGVNSILLSAAPTIKFSLVNFFAERGSKRREIGEEDKEADRTELFANDASAASAEGDAAVFGVGAGSAHTRVDSNAPTSPNHRRSESLSTLHNYGRVGGVGSAAGVGMAAALYNAAFNASSASPFNANTKDASPMGLIAAQQRAAKINSEYMKFWHGRAAASKAVLDDDGVCDLRPVFRIHHPSSNSSIDKKKAKSTAEDDDDDGLFSDSFCSSSDEGSTDATCFIHFVNSWLPRTTSMMKIESSTDVSLSMDEPLLHAAELFYDLMDALTMKNVGMNTVYGCRFTDDRYLPMRKFSKVRLSGGAGFEDRFLARDDWLAMNGILSLEEKAISPPPPMVPPFGPDGLVDGICIDLDFRRRFVMETMHDYSILSTRPSQPQPLPPDRQAAADVQLAQMRASNSQSGESVNRDALGDTQTSTTSANLNGTANSSSGAASAAAPNLTTAFLDRLPQGVTSKHHPVVRLIAEKGVMIRWKSCQAMNSTKLVARRPYLMVHKYVGRSQEQLATMKFPSGWQHQDRLLPQGQHGALYEVMAMPKKRASNISETTYVGKSAVSAAKAFSPTNSESKTSSTLRSKRSGGLVDSEDPPNRGGTAANAAAVPDLSDPLPLGDGSLTFEFQILYKPSNMSQQDWALLSSTTGAQVANPRDVLTKRMAAKTINTSGYMFTHFLTLVCEDLALNYVQTTMWPLLEHFSNGFITRSGYITQRGQLSLASPLADRQWSWRRVLAQNDKIAAATDHLMQSQSFPSNNPNAPKPSPATGHWHLNRPSPLKRLTFHPHSCASKSETSIVPPYAMTLLHQNIELRSVDCILPFHEDHCANILARADSIGMWSEINEVAPTGTLDTSSLDFSGLAIPMSVDCTTNFKMAFEGMRMWVATEPALAFMAQQTSNQNPHQSHSHQRQPSHHIRTAAAARTLWELNPNLTESALPHMRTASQNILLHHGAAASGVSPSSSSARILQPQHQQQQAAVDNNSMSTYPAPIGGVVSNAKGHQQVVHVRKPSAVPLHIRTGSEQPPPPTAATADSHLAAESGQHGMGGKRNGSSALLTPNVSNQSLSGMPKSILSNTQQNSASTRIRTKTVIIDDPTANFRHEPAGGVGGASANALGSSYSSLHADALLHHPHVLGATGSSNESVVNNFPADFSTCLLGLTTVPTQISTVHNPDGTKQYVCKITATTADMTEVVSGMRCEFTISWELSNSHQRLSEKHMNLQFGDFMFHGSSKQLAAVCDWVCGAFMEPYVNLYPAKYPQPKAFVVWSQWISKHHPDIERIFSAPMGSGGINAMLRVLSPLSKRPAGEWTIGAQRMCIHLQDPETKIRSARIIEGGSNSGGGGGAVDNGSMRRRAASRAPNAPDVCHSPPSHHHHHDHTNQHADLSGPAIVRDPINIVIDISKGAHMNIQWMRDGSFKSRYAFGAISGWDLTLGALRSHRKGDSKFIDNVREVVTSRRRFLRIEYNAPWKRRLQEAGGKASSPSSAAPATSSPNHHQDADDDDGDGRVSSLIGKGRAKRGATMSAASAPSPLPTAEQGNVSTPVSQLSARSKALLGPNISAANLPAVKPTTVQLLDGLAFDLSQAGLDVFYGYTVGGPDEKLVYCDLTVDSFDLQIIPRFFVDVKDSLLSLTVRNSMAPMFKWPCYAIGETPKPADPTAQQWRSENNFKINASYIVLLEDPRARKPLPLYFITMKGISFENSSDACQTNKAMHLKIGGISSNGLVSDRATVVPLIAMQSPENEEQRRITHLVDIRKDRFGLRGVVGCLWFLSPLKHKLLQLKAAATHPSMSEFSWLSTYAEERSTLLLGSTQQPQAPAAPPTINPEAPKENDIYIVVHNPRLVIAEHSTLELSEKSGITINFGLIAISKSLEEVQVPVEEISPTTTTSTRDGRPMRRQKTTSDASSLPTLEDAPSSSTAAPADQPPLRKDVQTRYKVDIAKMNISSLTTDDEGNERFLLYPSDISAGACISNDGLATDAFIDVKKVKVDIGKDDYEWALHSATRHLVSDEDNMISKKEAQAIANSQNVDTSASGDRKASKTKVRSGTVMGGVAGNGGDASISSRHSDSEYSKTTNTAPGISLRTIDQQTGEIRRRLMSLRKKKVNTSSYIAQLTSGALGLAGITDGVPLLHIPVQALKAKVAWESLQMRVHSETVAVYVSLSAVKADFNQSKPKLPDGLSPSLTIPVTREKDVDSILAARTAASAEHEMMQRSMRIASNTNGVVSSSGDDDDDDGLIDVKANPTVRHTVQIGSQLLDTAEKPLIVVPPSTMALEASIGKLEIGVEGTAPLLSISAPNAESVRFASTDYKMTVDAAIGALKCTLEHRSVVQAIQFLYEPYRRIVLPRYGLAQVITYAHCYNEIRQRLVLSGRTVARFSSEEFNHITVNGNGNEIHFIDAGSPIVILDPGLTVYFTNAKLHLYGHLLEHFTSAGNGSYVVVDDTCQFVEPQRDSDVGSDNSDEEILSAGGMGSEDDHEEEYEADENAHTDEATAAADDAFTAEYPKSSALLYPTAAHRATLAPSTSSNALDMSKDGDDHHHHHTQLFSSPASQTKRKRSATRRSPAAMLGLEGADEAMLRAGMNSTPPPLPQRENGEDEEDSGGAAPSHNGVLPLSPSKSKHGIDKASYALPLLLSKNLQPVSRQIDARGSFEIVLPEVADGPSSPAASGSSSQRGAFIRRALSVKLKLIVGHRTVSSPSVDPNSQQQQQQRYLQPLTSSNPSPPFSFDELSNSNNNNNNRFSTMPTNANADFTNVRGSGAALGAGAADAISNSVQQRARVATMLGAPQFITTVNEQACAFLNELHAECEYFGKSGTERIDYTTLITPWEMRVSIVGSDAPIPFDNTRTAHDLAATYGHSSTSAQQQQQQGDFGATYGGAQPSSASSAAPPTVDALIMRRKVFLEAESRVEFRFRYGDISLVTNSFEQLKQAFGHIEHEVINAAPSDQSGFEHLSKASKEEQQKTAAKASVITIVTTVKQIAFFIVDDTMFGAHTNVPLVSITISNIVTPVLELSSYTMKAHISAELEIQYYNLTNGAWASLLEAVPFDFVFRNNKNVTMEDVVMRKGNQKAGLKFRALNMHVTPVLVQVIGRVLQLKKRLAELTAEGRGTAAADAKANAAADRDAASRNANLIGIGSPSSKNRASMRYSSSVDALANSSFHVDPNNKKKESNNTFFAYTITQQLGHDVEIEFCNSTGDRRSNFRRHRLAPQGSFSFDYPRDVLKKGGGLRALSDSDGSADYPMAEHCINVIVRKGDSGPADELMSKSGTNVVPYGGGGGGSSAAGTAVNSNSLRARTSTTDSIPSDDGSPMSRDASETMIGGTSSSAAVATSDANNNNNDDENTVKATVWIAKVGLTFINVGLPTKPRYIIVDVVVSQGTKRVLLRTNVSFTNRLPFGVSFKQVGCIEPNKTVTVPRETLRKRCTFLPTVPGGAPDEICMGVSYDALQDFYDQRFLCTARIRKPRSDIGFGAFKKTHLSNFNQLVGGSANNRGRSAANPAMLSADDTFVADNTIEHAYYMILTFDSYKTIPLSDIVDCHATLEAPFNIVNATGQPIRVTMHYRAVVPKKSFFRSEEFVFPKIDRITIDREERYPVTQVDPFEDMYLSVEIGQPTGDGLTSFRKNKHCVMVRSTSNAKERATSVKLVDSRGEELELTIEYSGKDIIFSCPFWIINQTQHYLQITTTSQKKRQNCLVAGMSGDGLGPSIDTPFLIHTPKMKKDPMDAHLYIRVGRLTSSGDGSVMWSQWSDKVFVNAIGELSIITCGTSGEVVSLSYSVALVGGVMKSTRVVKITPRWIVINRLKYPITISQNTVRSESHAPPLSVQQQKMRRSGGGGGAGSNSNNTISHHYSPDDTIASGLLKVLDTCAPVGTGNTIAVRHGDGNVVSTFSAPISIERLGDHAINLVHMVEVTVPNESSSAASNANNNNDVLASSLSATAAIATAIAAGSNSNNSNALVAPRSPRGKQRTVAYERSYVVHVTCYSRASTLFICVDEPEKPPHLIENRTRFQINVRQRDTNRGVVVYRFHTLGFVWEDAQAPKVLQMWMSEGNAASKPITINLDPSMLVKREHQLSQVIRTLGGIDLFVRVRAFGGSYAISITEDTLIDKARAMPFQQYRYQLQIDAINILAADAGRDILLLTVGHKGGGISASVSQHRVRDADTDEQVIEVSYGVIQISDEQQGAEQRVVLQTLMNRASTLKICRRLQRKTPMLQITAFEVSQQPVMIHLADSFLFAIMHLAESMQKAVGKNVEPTKQSFFATTPWHVELSTPAASPDSLQNRIAFVERMNISQITVSISLYRGGSEDPIGDRLGSFVSMLIRSVNDARFDWRRIEYDNIYDRLWLLGTFLSNYYSTELQRQLLNVVHVAGLDVMRGFVTDLLEGYFMSNAPVNMSGGKSTALVPLRDAINFRQETNNVQTIFDADMHPALQRQIDLLALRNRGSALSSLNDYAGRASGIPLANSVRSTAALAVGGGGGSAANDGKGPSIPMKELRHGGILGRVEKVSLDVYAERVPFSEFVANVTKSEFKRYGHLAIRQYLRTRDFAISPLLMCTRCIDLEALRETHAEENYNSVLPHPNSRHISWAELAHHASWEEMTELCSAEELARHAETLKTGIAGQPMHVVRIDAEMERNIRQEVVGFNTAAAPGVNPQLVSQGSSSAAESSSSPAGSPLGNTRE